jgi:drug/metabolite transporter (DMT)-like permease
MAADARSAPQEPVLAGIGFTLAGYLLFSLQDATIKWLSAEFPAPQILFLRSLIIVPFCLFLGGRGTARRAMTSPIRLQLLWRSLVLLAAWLCYYSAARYLQLAELVTLYFSSPLLVAALAVPLLKERLTRTRWVSLVIGFAGVVIACQPGDLHQPYAIALALIAAGLWAYTAILIRQIVKAETTPVVMLVGGIVFIAACGAAMPFLWRAPSAWQWILLLLVGIFGALGQFMSTEGIRRAPATVTAPISFSSLLWGFILGFIIFGDVPRSSVFLGASLILTSGLIVAGGEWRQRRARLDGTAGAAAE